MGNSVKVRIICVIVGKNFPEGFVGVICRIKWTLKLGVGSVKNQHFWGICLDENLGLCIGWLPRPFLNWRQCISINSLNAFWCPWIMPEPDVILDMPKGIYDDVIMHLSKDKGDNKKVTSKDEED